MTVEDLLAANNINLPSAASGRYYVTCPRCSAKRSRAHQKLKCLGVNINGDSVNWGCNHCSWTGPEQGATNGAGDTRSRQGPESKQNPIIDWDNPEGEFFYRDENSSVIYKNVRFPLLNPDRTPILSSKGKPDKTFRQFRKNGVGFVPGLGSVTPVPYRLDETKPSIANGYTIFIPEGEAKADLLWSMGFASTSIASAQCAKAHVELFRDADVVLLPDNDRAGDEHADEIASVLATVTTSIRILALPRLKLSGDIKDWVADCGGTVDEFKTLTEQAPEWQPSPPRDDEGVSQDAEGIRERTESTAIVLPFINMSNWDNEPVPDQEWAVFNRIPLRQAALFSGEGAAGKSSVQLHLSAAHVLGRDWLGTLPEPGPAMFVDAEDDEDVMHRRLAAIAKYYQVTFADLIKGGLHLISLAGHDAVLAVANRAGKIEPTPLYKKLFEAVGDIKPKMTGIASSANVFAGNEIDRSQVQQFASLLTRLAIVGNGSVALISHPSLTGINSGSGLSGTTQWHNAFRARLYMKSVNPKDGEQPDTDLREIEFKKNQYGPVSESIVLRYKDGLFLPLSGVSSLDKAAAAQNADDVFLKLLRRFNGQGQDVGAMPGPNFAPSVFAKHPDAAGFTSKKLREAMQRLLDNKTIKNEPFGPPSKNKKRLVIP
jgi:RecA-family ATPase